MIVIQRSEDLPSNCYHVSHPALAPVGALDARKVEVGHSEKCDAKKKKVGGL